MIKDMTMVRYRGLSTDTKPASPAAGSTFHEMDTGIIFAYDAVNDHWEEMLKGKEHTVSGSTASFTTALTKKLKALTVTMEPVQEGSGDPSPDNVRPITGHSSVNVYVGAVSGTADATYTTALGQTVYGGTLNVTTGVLTVTDVAVDMGTLTWISKSTGDSMYYQAVLRGGTKEFTTATNSGFLCSMYPYGQVTNATTVNKCVCMDGTPDIRVRDTDYSTIADFQAAVSGQTFVYPLKTPVTAQLTAQEVRTLRGNNVIWSDSGDVSVTYLDKT